jgi:polysaccharide transporter, PST family
MTSTPLVAFADGAAGAALDRGNGKAGPLDLRDRSIRGGAVTIGAQVMSYGITLVSVAVLARLLTPEDYGTIAMVVALTGLLNLFREMGLSGATIQWQNLSHGQLSNLFYVNAALGAAVMLATIASAPMVASFYGKPYLVAVTVGLSFSSLFSSLGTQHAALLTRHMRFRALAAVQLSSLLVAFAVAVAVALRGGGYWALVASHVTAALWSTAGFWVLSGFRPDWPRKGTDIRPLLRFGANIAGFDLAYYFRGNVDKILLGRVWGAQALGLYDKAFSLLLLPIAGLRHPLNKVAFPAMSALATDARRYRSYFVQYCALLAFISMPLVAFLYGCSDSVIRLLLGERWSGAAALFRILAIAGFIETVATLRTTVMLSSGFGGRLFLWGLLNSGVTVAAVIAGLPWGARGVAIAYCIGTYAAFHPLLVFSFHRTLVTPGDFYRAITRPAVAALGMLAIYLLVVEPLLDGPDVLVLLASAVACALAYLGVFAALPGGVARLRDYACHLFILAPGWLRRRCAPAPQGVS